MLTHIRKLLWRLLAAVALLLGVIGLFLPIVPTVPFVLLAAWASSKGWPQLEKYLLSHHYCGPQIRAWREHGAIARKAKYMAAIMISGSIALLWYMPFQLGVQIAISVIMIGVIVWLWTRPDAL